ncbi:adenylylsulfate kinase [Rubricella aquisinus]|uniref:Adenylylsulfate kinase n=1 Tax=Rubricella aquisinus TaxID=2028108 RepID=A0A840WWT0_9RHOB|nr:adenylyl-sulfate kinase [Rubricella aquisinus]MBB5515640.1 adenylylsulfate kinase [Rubricella aquisinus]
MILWFIGLSGSGKTTLGREVYDRLKTRHANTVFLDGDELRAVFAADRDKDAYTVAGRRRNAERITALCEMLDRQGIHVVCCILSLFPDMQAANRTRFSRYFEVFMDAPIEVLQARDVKGLYARAARGEAGEVVGIDIPFPRPEHPDMVIASSGDTPDLAKLAEQIIARAAL